MAVDDGKRDFGKDLLLASALVAAGLLVSAFSLIQLSASRPSQQLAQATQPLQGAPPADQNNKPPADPKPGGDRPTTPAPEPARPDPDAQKAGAEPALPPAPAEKTAPPIQQK